MVEDTLNNLICLGKAGKVKYQAFPNDLSELVRVVERHARKDLRAATPWLPEDRAEWLVKDVWDTVLHTDILVYRAGWSVAIDWTLRDCEVSNKLRKMDGVSKALCHYKIDRAVVVLVHQVEDAPKITWQQQLDAVLSAACKGDDFVSDGEIYF